MIKVYQISGSLYLHIFKTKNKKESYTNPEKNKTPAISFKTTIFLTKPIVAVTAEIVKIDNKINVNGIFYILSQLHEAF